MSKINEIMAKAALNTYRDGWNMANADGRKQAIEEAQAQRQALKDAGYAVVPVDDLSALISEAPEDSAVAYKYRVIAKAGEGQ